MSETEHPLSTSISLSIDGTPFARGRYVTIGSESYRVSAARGTTLTIRPAHTGAREALRRAWENWVAFPIDDLCAWWHQRMSAR